MTNRTYLIHLNGIDARRLLLEVGLNPNYVNEDAFREYLNKNCLGISLSDHEVKTIAGEFPTEYRSYRDRRQNA